LGDDPFERRLEAHGWIDVVVIHAHKQSAEAPERRGDGEHGAVDRIDVDAHLQRRIAVLGRCAHSDAELGEAQEGVKKRGADNADGGDEQIHRPDRNASDREAPIWQIARNGARIRRADELHELIEYETQADRRQQGSGANGRIWPAMMSAELPEGWA
jgi:hypothetical protein